MNIKHKFSDFLREYNLQNLKINLPFIEAEFNITDDDLTASWDIYIELATRITTQTLDDNTGVEQAALKSVYDVFIETRETLKTKGRKAPSFSYLSICMLNNCMRPFLAKWHKISEEGGFADAEKCLEFREELRGLQEDLKKYSALFANLAVVDNNTIISENPIS